MKRGFPQKKENKKSIHPAGVLLCLAGIACVAGGIYLALKDETSTGWVTNKYSPGYARSINGYGIIFFGIIFIYLGIWFAKPEKKN